MEKNNTELTRKQVAKKLKSIICKTIIDVTRQHIKDGKPEDATQCPVALGTKDKFTKVLKDHMEIDEFTVNHEEMTAVIMWNNWRVVIEAAVPKLVGQFIKEVDKDLDYEEKKLKPMKFKYRNVRVEAQ